MIETSSLLFAVIIGGVIATLSAVIIGVRMMNGSNAAQSVKLNEIHLLVDGRYSKVLDELAIVKQLLANVTHSTSDQHSANIARQNADDQAGRVAESEAAKSVLATDAAAAAHKRIDKKLNTIQKTTESIDSKVDDLKAGEK